MKKLLSLLCAVAMIVSVGIGFTACDKSVDGTYVVSRVEVLGVDGSRTSLKKYINSLSDAEIENNQLIPAINGLINITLKLKGNGDGLLTIKEAGKLFGTYDQYQTILDNAAAYGVSDENGDITFKRVKYETGKKSAISIFPTDEDGELISGGFGELLGGYFEFESLEGKYGDGQLKVKAKISIPMEDSATGVFIVNPAITLVKK